MTQRRKLLQILSALAVLGASSALAQRRGRPARIAPLDDAYEAGRAPLWARFRARLKELGYAEGRDLLLEQRWARGEVERLPALAAELVALKPDVIVCAGTPSALAARNATAAIPIVAAGLADPVKSGLAASFARPGGNVTGNSIISLDLAGKWVQFLREIAPRTKSIAVLTHTDNSSAMNVFREVQERARPFGIPVQVLDGRNRENVERAFATMARERVDALVVTATAVVLEQRQQIVEAAARQRLPAIYARREYVDAGGLISYGTDLSPLYTRAADYVHRILQGTKPADLPIEQGSTFKLVVNQKTAKALGVKFPRTIVVGADEVIE